MISFCLRQFFAALKMEIDFYIEKFSSKERKMASSKSDWKSGFRHNFSLSWIAFTTAFSLILV